MDKITFIVPSIGRKSLTNSINSLISQTNENWECIIIYDGVDGYVFEDSRIKYINIEKIGGNSPVHGMSGLVRNHGLKNCKTKWIGFLDDDDTIDTTYVETLFKKYNEYDFVMWRMIYPNGKILPTKDEIKFGNIGISFCYKNKFDDLIFDSNRDGEDFDFVKKLSNLTSNYIFASEIMYKINH
jgi:glycosyltransferase involved in cell wall biosynthesis